MTKQPDPLREALEAFIQAPATIHDWDKVPTIVRVRYDELRVQALAALHVTDTPSAVAVRPLPPSRPNPTRRWEAKP